MPLLLRPNPVARRALVWRGSVRDTNAASRALTPVAATRHLFRDHSNGDQHGSRGHHESQHHHHHQAGQLHHRNPIYSQASGLSSDWASLYLGAKLALWSGLCYFPYDTIPRTLQEEGLKLVAYGRTSFTCWYVADGCVNFEALPRRALPRLPLAYTPGAAARSSTTAGDAATPGNDHVDMHGTPDSDSGGGSDNQLDGSKRTDREDRFATTPAAEARTAATTDAWRTINDDYPPDQPPPPPPPPPPPQQCTPAEGGSSTYEAGSAELQSSRIGGSTWAGHADDGRSSGHDTGSLQGHAHAASTPGKGQSSHAFDQGHSLRGGHIHLHRDSPPFHLRVQGAAAGPAGSGGGGGAHAEAMDQASPLAAPRHEPGTGPGLTSAVSAGTRCRFIFLRGVQWAAHDMNTLSLSASLAAFWPEPLLSPGGAAAEPATGREVSTGAGSASLSSSSSPAPSPSTPSSEQLVAHSGVAAMAREVLSVILPHIREATAAGVDHLVFAGHSLGGALAKLLWAMSILQGHRFAGILHLRSGGD
ncbi:hypothetical protein Vretifemale_11562 [Volvox reticuliferus]|uniref:Fungal lipase-type domain-containing protein n=1 Tax=Volvox reticuliferus TaxID=1737510 RepID=A0A8J4CGM0_9CHLO|nr:hypothetical protein Vretifemale_11562 [Volvox reticuliferus]